jgi:hypothetical protein
MLAVVLRRLIAAASLIVLSVTQIAPHRHADLSSQKQVLTHCDGPKSGVPHLHPDFRPQTDGCLACFRHHLNATVSKISLTAPHVLVQFVIVAGRVAHAYTLRLRQSSRAPPVLAC